MAVLVGVFDSQSEAEQAFVRLRESGIPEDNLALVSHAHGTVVPTTAADLESRHAVGAPMAGAVGVAPSGEDSRATDITAISSLTNVADITGGTEGTTHRDTRQNRDARDEASTRELPVGEAVVPPAGGENSPVDNAALGAAIGVIAGGGMMGPIGAVLGAAAGAGIGGLLSGRGVSSQDTDFYEDSLRRGRFLVAVETDDPTPELRAILQVAGADRIEVK